MNISWAGAALAGALSFLSPCVLPLVVPYLCYMAGVSAEDLRAQNDSGGFAPAASARRRAAVAAIVFIFGFSLVFVALGAGATVIGAFLLRFQREFAIAAAVLIVLMGLNFLGVFRLALFSREARFQAKAKPASLCGAFLMGLAFAFGWTPCIGPILAVILAQAASKQTMIEGMTLLAVYSLGLGVPFLLAALFSGLFMQLFMRFRRHLGLVEKFIGALLVLTGFLFMFGFMQSISSWLLDIFPAWTDWLSTH